jgi:filamentous hemagglutinin family protein
VNFKQPSSSAIALNRVIGNEKSVIDGALNANGKVFIINSNGVLFGKGASVNVGGLVASTLDIADEDFRNDKFSFKAQKAGGEVVNMGNIKAAENGYVALMGEKVRNEGVIVAEKGTVSLNGAKKTTLNFNGDSLVNVSLDEGVLDALVESKNAIVADGGRVILTAKAADDVVASQVNTDGIIEAKTLGELTGSIEVNARGGTARIAGKLDASAPSGGDGGFIETSVDKVIVADGAVITTKSKEGKSGTWLIDPKDYTVAASGGDITGQTLSANLGNNGNVSIESTQGQKDGTGDINVNDRVSWSTDSTLTLTAERDININNAIDISGNGTLVLLPGGDYNILTPASYSGSEVGTDGYPIARVDTSGGVYGSVTFNSPGGSLYIGGTDNDFKYTLISNLAGLQAINNNKGNYALAKNLDLTSETFTAAVVETLAAGSVFTGLGHTISNLTITNATINAGLFGIAASAAADASGPALITSIRDIGLLNTTITATGNFIGALVGNNNGSIKNVYAKGGKVTGNQRVGGLVGNNQVMYLAPSYTDLFTDIEVAGNYYVGGLVGYTIVTANENTINFERIHAFGNVKYASASGASSRGQMGGLFGTFLSSANIILKDSYATGAVVAEVTSGLVQRVGGLFGNINNGGGKSFEISNSFATGAVKGGDNVGGLIGYATVSGLFSLSDSYATGNVESTGIGNPNINGVAGGLIAYLSVAPVNDEKLGAKIARVYATGDVTIQAGTAGGLIGSSSKASSSNQAIFTISDAHATGNVLAAATVGTITVGGLIGSLASGYLENSYATGDVTSLYGASVGGLVGTLSSSTITGSYATGDVTGMINVGGLVGEAFRQDDLSSATVISDSYATGIATLNDPYAHSGAGGLVGKNTYLDIEITNSYWNEANAVGYNTNAGATTTVSGSGGLVADQFGDPEIVQGIVNGRTPTEIIDARIAAAQAAAQAAAAARVEAIVEVAAVADKEQLRGSLTVRSGPQRVSVANTESVSLETAIAGYPDQFGTYPGTGGYGGSYSATIKSVTADGVTYFVDEDDEEAEK